MKLAHVFVEHPIMHLDHTFTYRCDGFDVQRGVRVMVPFKTTFIMGFVSDVKEVDEKELDSYPYELKYIESVVDQEPLINEELFQLGDWMAKQYVAPRISCFQCMLPAKLKPRSTSGSIKMEAWVRYIKDCDKLTKKQADVLTHIREDKEMLRSTYYQMYKTPGKKLIELGCVEVFEKEAQASLGSVEINTERVCLSEEQRICIEAIEQEKHHQVFLLHGTTGSGKTEVFLRLAQHVMEQGKQVLILVPEISLTPQMVGRVKSRFGGDVAIYHSGLNAQEKYEQYQLVKQHRVRIVVGTRSAIFMPFDQLGLIIMDEEHDTSYKQDSTPRYHCRDIVLHRGVDHDALVVLASATPSLESFARAHKNIYRLLSMPSRINGSFPKVKIVEMRKAVGNGEDYLLSNALLDAIYERLQKREQIILLLNRRGYTPILRCISCGYVQMCPHCDTAMSYHKDEGVLKCHICAHTMKLPNQCPTCGASSWRYLGSGTQKLEELVQIKFPQAKIIRMDTDTTGKKNAHENYLRDFGEKKADILLGTQMIAKGLDFENVTLVGILNGDAMLNRSDYRSAELTYDLLEQASGRSGRGDKDGEVIIQAYDGSHYAIQCAAQHDYLRFFQNEMNYRHLANYPPYTYLTSFMFSHKEEELARKASQKALELLQKKQDIKVLGPSILHKMRDETRIRILIKGKSETLLAIYAKDVYDGHLSSKQKARLDIDLAPLMLE
ncbi:replication restart helicase PriA [Amedibacillus sp. YH-ame6]